MTYNLEEKLKLFKERIETYKETYLVDKKIIIAIGKPQLRPSFDKYDIEEEKSEYSQEFIDYIENHNKFEDFCKKHKELDIDEARKLAKKEGIEDVSPPYDIVTFDIIYKIKDNIFKQFVSSEYWDGDAISFLDVYDKFIEDLNSDKQFINDPFQMFDPGYAFDQKFNQLKIIEINYSK